MDIKVPKNSSAWLLAILSLGALAILAYGNLGPRPNIGALIPFELLGQLGLDEQWLSELNTHSDKVAHIIAGAFVSSLVFGFSRPRQTSSKTTYLAHITLIALGLFTAAEALQYFFRSFIWCALFEQTDGVVEMCKTLSFSIADINASFIGHLIMLCVYFWLTKKRTTTL